MAEHRLCQIPKSSKLGAAQRYLAEVVLAYEGNECLIWPYARTYGRGIVTLGGVKLIVSRWLCEEINGPPPSPKHEAAHGCGNGHLGCVTKNHLRWATRKENREDRKLHGTWGKLAPADVNKIRALKGAKSENEIGAMFGVSGMNIHAIHIGKSWGWLPWPSVDFCGDDGAQGVLVEDANRTR